MEDSCPARLGCCRAGNWMTLMTKLMRFVTRLVSRQIPIHDDAAEFSDEEILHAKRRLEEIERRAEVHVQRRQASGWDSLRRHGVVN